jgi:O-antigen/teichoic acid export membrane protein
MRGVLRTGLFLGIGQVGLRGAVAVYTLVLVRHLSETDYGRLAYLLALGGILLVLGDGGLSRLLIRDVANAEDDRDVLIRGVMSLRLWSLAAIVVVAAALILADADAPQDALPLFLIYLGCEVAAAGFEAASLGADRPFSIAGGQLLGAAVLVAASVAVLLSGEVSLPVSMAAFAGAAALKLAWQVAVWRGVMRARHGVDRAQRRRWIREAAPFLALAILGVIYYRIDLVILHAVDGSAGSASYGAAYRVVDASLTVAGVLMAAIAARVSRLHRDRPERVWSEWKRVTGRIAAVAVGPVVLITVLAHPIAELLFGERYRSSAGADLRLLAPGILFMVLQTVNATFLFTSHVQRRLLRNSIWHVVLNVVLTYFLVKAHGSNGAAAATTISEMLAFTYFAFFVRRVFTRPPANVA